MKRAPAPSGRTDLFAPDACTCFNLRKAARAVTQLYDDALRPSGLRATQFSLLTTIGLARRVSISELADLAVMDRTTLARNLTLLEREGLIRSEAGDDARVREVSLTPTAREKLAVARACWLKIQGQMVDRLGNGRTERLLGDLSAAVGAAQAAGAN